jgi:predicted permease
MLGPRLFRLLLLAYPPSLRREFGVEMSAAVDEAWASNRGVSGRLRFLGDLLADFLTSWPRAWRRRAAPRTRRYGRPHRSFRMSSLSRDIRQALRLFRSAPLFALGAVLTLALGIGTSAAIFSLADATLLRPLPIPHADRVVQAGFSWGAADTWDLARQQQRFDAVGGWCDLTLGMTLNGVTTNVTGLAVTGGYFDVVNLPAEMGQLITAQDDRPGTRPVAVISDGLWRRQFAADPHIIGQTVALNRRDVVIIGVAPAGFRGLSLDTTPDVYVPMASLPQVGTGFLARPGVLERRDMVWIDVALRMKPGTTIESAANEVEGIYRQLHPPSADEKEATPGTFALDPLTARAAGLGTRQDLSRLVTILMGATLVTLLLSCATVANLLLVRAERRRRELAVRGALGASMASIVRLLFLESLAIGLAGAAAGVLVARASLSLLGAFLLPGGIAIGQLGLEVNGTILAASAALGILTSLLFGLAPVWRATRLALSSSLRDGARGATRQPLRAALVTAQVALCVILVGGSLAFGRAIQRALAIDLGFSTAHSSLTTVNPALVRYDTDRVLGYQRDVLEAMSAAPQVQAAGWAAIAPLKGRMQWTATFAGYVSAPSEGHDIDANVVSPGYFDAMEMRVLDGRDFAASDTAAAPNVVVVNAAAVRKYFGDRSAVGGQVTFDPDETPVRWSTIVGVVNDVRRAPGATSAPMMYLPTAQNPSFLNFGAQHLIVRSALPPAAAVAEVAAILTRVDPIVPIMQQQTMSDHLARLLMPQRLGLTLFALFAGMAVVLTALGIYAVVAYAVAHRTPEIGLRMALGASRSNVLRLVMRQGAVPVVLGLLLGLGGFAAASRGLQQFMFDQAAADPVALGGLALVVGVVAALAMIIPAGRAIRVDPTIALRAE